MHTEFHSPCSDEGEEDIYDVHDPEEDIYDVRDPGEDIYDVRDPEEGIYDVHPEEEVYDGAQEMYEALVSEIIP